MKERITQAIEQGFEKFLWNSRFIVILAVVASMISSVLAGTVYSYEKPAGPDDPHHARPPAVKGNPAADPTAPLRIAEPGRLLLSCISAKDPRPTEIYASARDFGEGKQSFYLRRWTQAEAEIIYPLHGHFLDGGAAGIFMVHDGKGMRQQAIVRIDQTVNMGLFFLWRTAHGLRAVIDSTFPLEAAADAFALMERGGHFGKIVVSLA